MKKTLLAMLVATIPITAQAQQYNTSEMQAGLSMLETSVDRILDRNGFTDVDPRTLDLRTIVEIVNIVREENNDGGGVNHRQAIEVALKRRLP